MKYFIIFSLLVFSCAGPTYKKSAVYTNPDAVQSIDDLEPGQTMKNIKDGLGKPESTQFIKGQMVLKYVKKQYWGKPNLPYYLLFSKEGKLVEWVVNQREAHESQRINNQMWQGLNFNSFQNQQPQPAQGQVIMPGATQTRCQSTPDGNGGSYMNCQTNN